MLRDESAHKLNDQPPTGPRFVRKWPPQAGSAPDTQMLSLKVILQGNVTDETPVEYHIEGAELQRVY